MKIYSKDDAIKFLYGFEDAVANADYADTTYHLLNYFFHDDPSRFLWANFTNSKESMDKANASFEASVRDKMFPLFSEFASCGEQPDLYNGFTLYWSEKKDFYADFSKTIRVNIMEYLVLADFKTKQGMANDMAAIFKEALVETRAFEGCNAIDVYFEEKNKHIYVG